MQRARVLVALATGVTIAAIVVPGALALRRAHPDRVPVDDDPGRHGLAFEDVTFVSLVDGTRLSGWYLPSPIPSQRAIVIVPGIDDNRLQGGVTLQLAPALVQAGFDVLAFDLRGEGDSGPGPITFGAREQWDVLAAVALARDRGAERVGVLAFSLGAGATMLAAAHSTEIDALVLDSGWFDLRESLTRELRGTYGLPAPLADYGLLLLQLATGTDLASIAPGAAIGAIPGRPILLIHGLDDATVPASDSERLAAGAGPGAAQLWLVPGGQHTRSYHADPAGYERRVVDFFSRVMPSSRLDQ